MKALSFTQPWAQLVALGEKKVETRSWRTSTRGLVAIHAAKAFPISAWVLSRRYPYYGPALEPWISRFPLGAIIGTVEIVDTWRTSALTSGGKVISAKENAFGDYGPNRWAWNLQNPKLLAEPIPCRGHLGLWQVPDEIEEGIRDA